MTLPITDPEQGNFRTGLLLRKQNDFGN